ncbi:hypothetical protein HGB13_04130, partial [bacterium]|nr:hypothetical protein [bacterium]
DIYNYTVDRNQEFIEQNFTDSAAKNLDINVIGALDTVGNVIIVKEFEGEDKKEVLIGDKEVASLANGYKNIKSDKIVEGFIGYKSKPMIISYQDILSDNGEGPSRGTLFMGRYVDNLMLQRISDIVQAESELKLIDNAISQEEEYKEAFEELDKDNSSVFIEEEGDNIAGFSYFSDMTLKPIIIAEVELPRDLYKSTLFNSMIFFILMTLSTATIGWSIFYFNKVHIIDRIVSLTEFIEVNAHDHTFSARVKVEGEDEITSLEKAFNEIIDGLDKYRK